jgi:hypothetical protein
MGGSAVRGTLQELSTATARAPGLAAFRDAHQGETLIVCGCGPSLQELASPERCITIGVNDVGRLFDPTYLVVVNPRNQFKAERFAYVERSRSKFLFTQLDLGPVAPPVVRFKLGRFGGTDVQVGDVLHYTQNSPYVAVCLAAYMGARRIGLIGVDFTDGHFFAPTGRHPLAGRLQEIDRQYGHLAQALRARGIELYNLSAASRLTCLPRKTLAELVRAESAQASSGEKRSARVFFVHYRFLACGEVFAQGLRHAAEELGIPYGEAWWEDRALPVKVRQFAPDVVFVVHGRRFVQRWRDAFASFNTAVWLLDEPYEVDDTASWSRAFRHVFVNDPATVERHENAHYLPVCFDPRVHFDADAARRFTVGFVGGANRTRESCLDAVARTGLLGYVVGGPWRSGALKRLSLGSNLRHDQVAELYRQTKIVVNVFRDLHHFNRNRIAASSLNPRVYEAIACGALVVSEYRTELAQMFPELPTFAGPQDLVPTIEKLLADRPQFERLRAASRARLANHTYADRLRNALSVCIEGSKMTPSPRAVGVHHAPRAVAGPPAERTPAFASMPLRHLLYHVWPVKGVTWRWNIDELLRRIDVFNGRRIIAIVHDERSDPPEAVQEALAGHGCEFIVAPNDPSAGEAATFPRLLERIASLDPSAVTFYAHAKGVKYEPARPDPVRRWTDALYRTNLDDWLRVKSHLEQFAFTGAFRLTGRFRPHRNLADWHYSGTFFWMRNARVFARCAGQVPPFYGGVETWPGLSFARTESGCLFMDQPPQLPYHAHFWRTRGNRELDRWQAAVRPTPPPPDLADPVPFEGHSWPRTEQKPDELAWCIAAFLDTEVHGLLTFGPSTGGVEWHVARRFRAAGRDLALTVVDPAPSEALTEVLADIERRFGQRVRVIRGDSRSLTRDGEIGTPCEAAFIDGDRSYAGAKRDYLFARAAGARVLALHDIVDSDWHVQSRCCVSRLWSELVGEAHTTMRAGTGWGGIGLVYPDRQRAESNQEPCVDALQT